MLSLSKRNLKKNYSFPAEIIRVSQWFLFLPYWEVVVLTVHYSKRWVLVIIYLEKYVLFSKSCHSTPYVFFYISPPEAVSSTWRRKTSPRTQTSSSNCFILLDRRYRLRVSIHKRFTSGVHGSTFAYRQVVLRARVRHRPAKSNNNHKLFVGVVSTSADYGRTSTYMRRCWGCSHSDVPPWLGRLGWPGQHPGLGTPPSPSANWREIYPRRSDQRLSPPSGTSHWDPQNPPHNLWRWEGSVGIALSHHLLMSIKSMV